MGTCAYGFKFVVAVADGLHLFVLRVPVEWRVSAEQKVAVRARQATGRETTGTLRRLRDDSGRPNISGYHSLSIQRPGPRVLGTNSGSRCVRPLTAI
jgi:hypothetical protein